MAGDHGDNPLSDNVIVLLIAMGSALFVVSMYHVVAICFCNQQRTTTNPTQPPRQPATPSLEENTSTSVANLFPTHKYHKRNKDDAVPDDEGGTCAVCLGDFEEGEELRTMPECLHSFHVSCIDMWLHSHSNCPVCRSSTAPSPAVNEQQQQQHNIDMRHTNMVPLAIMQSGLVRW